VLECIIFQCWFPSSSCLSHHQALQGATKDVEQGPKEVASRAAVAKAEIEKEIERSKHALGQLAAAKSSSPEGKKEAKKPVTVEFCMQGKSYLGLNFPISCGSTCLRC